MRCAQPRARRSARKRTAAGARITTRSRATRSPRSPAAALRSIPEAELGAVAAELDAWVVSKVATFDALTEGHRSAIEALNENSSLLAQQQAELDEALGRRSDAAKHAQRVASRLSAQLEQLNLEQQQLPAKRAQVEREIEHESHSVRAARAHAMPPLLGRTARLAARLRPPIPAPVGSRRARAAGDARAGDR
mgnify:CR=1 FL=1